MLKSLSTMVQRSQLITLFSRHHSECSSKSTKLYSRRSCRNRKSKQSKAWDSERWAKYFSSLSDLSGRRMLINGLVTASCGRDSTLKTFVEVTGNGEQFSISQMLKVLHHISFCQNKSQNWFSTLMQNFYSIHRLINIRSFIRVDSFPYAIEALLAGKRMDEFELLADQKVIDDCKWLLEKFLGKQLPRLTSMRRTRWLTNSNFFGTYSYQSLSADRNKVLPKDLAESLLNSVNKPIVLFAGEATDYEFPSNAHGAVSSGIRAAKEIIDYYK